MHKYSHHIQHSLSECVLTIYIHRMTAIASLIFLYCACRIFFPPTASLILLYRAHRIFFRRSPRYFFFFSLAELISFPSLPGACSQAATTDRHMHQDILAKFAKCRCFDFRCIIFDLLKGCLWKLEQFFLLWSFRIMVMWQKRQLAVAFYLHSFPEDLSRN